MSNVREFDLASMRRLWRAIPSEALSAAPRPREPRVPERGGSLYRNFGAGGRVVLGADAHGGRLFWAAGRGRAFRRGRARRAGGRAVMTAGALFTAREAAAALGGQVASATSVVCPGPGHSPRDRSLSVRFDPAAPDGFVVHSFAGDDPPSCRDHVREALGLGSWRRRGDELPRPRPRPAPLVPDDEAARMAAALRLWGGARDAQDTLLERYLASRGLELDDRAAGSLRFHPALRFEGRTTPGMIALFRDLRTDEPCGLHRTFLSPEGGKRGRRMLGRAKDAAVKLDPEGEVTLGLGIAEGIESGLAARRLFRPLWALGSAGAIRDFPVLGGVEALTIFADADPTGQAAAETCAARWVAAGAEVAILTSTCGSDANDALRAG